MVELNINDYDYDLPDDRIAQYPVEERDSSQLLVYKDGKTGRDIFKNITDFIPAGSLLVFNDTKVIRARIHFRKSSGANIEVLCLEPLSPSDYSISFSSKAPVEWKCIVGNLKKWKNEKLTASFEFKGTRYTLSALKINAEGDAWRIKFLWDDADITFGEVIESAGHIPLPPYIDRVDQPSDAERYQTVYSKADGSVAAPTAGLHFTETVFQKIKEKGIITSCVTLHVGAGTFQPVKASKISDHRMHCEHFLISGETIRLLLENEGKTIAVGTTSVRTIESLYWLGVKIIIRANDYKDLTLGQWEPYQLPDGITVKESLEAILCYLREQNSDSLKASTHIIIVPGYEFRLTCGLITNFHQPKSTLLLLISAWLGDKWKELYIFALDNGFRFLSYGDSSLLLK